MPNLEQNFRSHSSTPSNAAAADHMNPLYVTLMLLASLLACRSLMQIYTTSKFFHYKNNSEALFWVPHCAISILNQTDDRKSQNPRLFFLSAANPALKRCQTCNVNLDKSRPTSLSESGDDFMTGNVLVGSKFESHQVRGMRARIHSRKNLVQTLTLFLIALHYVSICIVPLLLFRFALPLSLPLLLLDHLSHNLPVLLDILSAAGKQKLRNVKRLTN